MVHEGERKSKPLRSDQVGFGGWRLGPWLALDGTHPETQRSSWKRSSARSRQEWGCTYFKLDAIYWGALHRARLHDPHATRIEAYRRGIEAIARGAGDAFILGCNHPMWPSLGLIDGARSSMDISRDWASIRDIGRQNLLRGWQNGRFWWNDPDCLLLSSGLVLDEHGETTGRKGLPENEVLFHAATVYATGGMLLSGNDVPKLGPGQVRVLRKMLPPTGHAARFADEQLTVGRTVLGEREWIYLFNWGETAACAGSAPRETGAAAGLLDRPGLGRTHKRIPYTQLAAAHGAGDPCRGSYRALAQTTRAPHEIP